VFLTELFRTAAFRITLMALAAMAGVMVMQFGLVYAQMEAVESRRSTELLEGEAELLAQMSPEHLEYVIRRRATGDLRLIINSAGLFDAGHALIAGDLHSWPHGLKADGKPHNIEIYPRKGLPIPCACWRFPCPMAPFWCWGGVSICWLSRSSCSGTPCWSRRCRHSCLRCFWALSSVTVRFRV
jgi:hypothetical protein